MQIIINYESENLKNFSIEKLVKVEDSGVNVMKNIATALFAEKLKDGDLEINLNDLENKVTNKDYIELIGNLLTLIGIMKALIEKPKSKDEELLDNILNEMDE